MTIVYVIFIAFEFVTFIITKLSNNYFFFSLILHLNLLKYLLQHGSATVCELQVTLNGFDFKQV